MIIRVQSSEGTRRIEVSPETKIGRVYEMAAAAFQLDSVDFSLYRNQQRTDLLKQSRTATIKTSSLCHGDMLFLVVSQQASANGSSHCEPMDVHQSSSLSHTNSSASLSSMAGSHSDWPLSARNGKSGAPMTNEHPVDQLLWKLDGKIARPRDPKQCHHGDNASCVYCTPLEPYNTVYLDKNNIKHMSFHSYLRKLLDGVDRGKFASVEDISCRIKPGCTDHPAWPRGICSRCQPSAVTLNRQLYRHVDSVVFENPALVDRFLDYWRRCGSQRCGFLLGRYQQHGDVPLGVRATIAAIYEPPQLSGRDHVQLQGDTVDSDVGNDSSNSDGAGGGSSCVYQQQMASVLKLAAVLQLELVGWVFTDLLSEDSSNGTVKHLRGADTWFLSAQECMMAGYFQSLHTNPCRLSPTGQFGSKFVTVVVSGDREKQVHMEGYQLSNQGTALVRDKCLLPTLDAPELAWVRESTNDQYVPDVFYKEKDGYGNEVSRLARPLPVAYLLVDVPVSTPREPLYTFPPHASHIQPFPIENRSLDGQCQDFAALAQYLSQFDRSTFLQSVSDFHVLLYLASSDTIDIKENLDLLLEAVQRQDTALADQFYMCDQWQTVVTLLEASRWQPSDLAQGASGSSHGGVGGTWPCSRCTFINPVTRSQCEMCQLPRQ